MIVQGIGLLLFMSMQVIASIKEPTPPTYKFRIAMVSDLEEKSKSDTELDTWISYFKMGKLDYDLHLKKITINWDDEGNGEEHKSHNSSDDTGRGFELSELVTFYGRLITFDDETGLIYLYDDSEFKAWTVIQADAQNSTTGMKIEWSTNKNGHLYVGSTGRDKSSSVVAIVHKNGNIEYLNWETHYAKLRKYVNMRLLGYVDGECCVRSNVYRQFFLPSKVSEAKSIRSATIENDQKITHLYWEDSVGEVKYITHEACMWSDVHQRFFFLPRKASMTDYNENEDDYKGTNILLSATADFNDIQVKTIGRIVPDRGYSSFKFIPKTNDNVIVAILTAENIVETSNITTAPKTTATYITAFTVDGEIILEQTKVSDVKFEGFEFI